MKSCSIGLGLVVLVACAKPPTSKQVGAVAEASCTLLQAFAESPEEEAICATADDLIDLAMTVRAERSDAGPGKLGRKSGQCKIVGDVCATDVELAIAIKAHKAAVK
jgi:hypothetical protein